MDRRRFLWGAAATGLAGWPASASARTRTWGDPPPGAEDAVLPPGVRAEKCLEVYLYGGLGPFESFYVNEEFGRPDDPTWPDQQWHLFADDHQAVFGDRCDLPSADWLLPYAVDSVGRTLNLGPTASPLHARPDLIARMRVVVMQHDLLPHEAAIPLALSGQRLGNSRMCGLGAHIQRYRQARATSATPFSYVFLPDTELSTDNLRAATAVGLHPGSTRPLGLTISLNTAFPTLLARDVLGSDRATVDQIRATLDDALRGRFTDALGPDVRSRALADHAYALATLRDSPLLQDILRPELFTVGAGEMCGSEGRQDLTTTSLSAAVALLTDAASGAAYVNVVDGGLIPAEGGGTLDTHGSHLTTHARNLNHTLRGLCDRINRPGENDPAKIDLDQTLVLITTEFGRTPVLQELSRDGTNHHPGGYVQIVLGGPITAAESGVSGEIGPDGMATDFATPTEFRIGVMAALGMWPFSSESFAVGDVRGAGSELEALAMVKDRVLGRPS